MAARPGAARFEHRVTGGNFPACLIGVVSVPLRQRKQQLAKRAAAPAQLHL